MLAILFIIFAGAAGAYFTSIGCRRAHARHRRPSWRYAWLGTFITVLLSVLMVCQGDLFRPNRWDGKVSIWFTVIAISVLAGLVALVASAIVLQVFWRKFKYERMHP
jgi:hypothetical protein